ncbi:CHASE2 domain-containing protein [Aliamphritea spongicola]|nr:CHASE2 domain-containing protein [Aliamphritea spongicola]
MPPVFLYSGVGDARWPALAMAMLRVKGETEQLDNLINVENTPVIRSDYWLRQQSIMIPFAKTGDRPQTYSWADIISGRVPAEAIRGKYVLVGATATGLGMHCQHQLQRPMNEFPVSNLMLIS